MALHAWRMAHGAPFYQESNGFLFARFTPLVRTLSLYGFKFPLFMSLAHMGFSFLALLPIMLTRSFYDLHVPTLQKQWPGILAIGSFFAVNVGARISACMCVRTGRGRAMPLTLLLPSYRQIGFNNISLLSIPLSLNQVIR